MSSRDPSQEDYDYKPKNSNISNGFNIQRFEKDNTHKGNKKQRDILALYFAFLFISFMLNIYLLYKYENTKKAFVEICKLQADVVDLKKKLRYIQSSGISNNSCMYPSNTDQILDEILGLGIYSSQQIQPCNFE